MLRRVKMLGSVLVFRGVAATNVAAGKTKAKVDPRVARFEAFFAAVGLRFDALDLIEVRAGIGHCFLQ